MNIDNHGMDSFVYEKSVMEKIIEHNPSIAIRVVGTSGEWETSFISKNISKYGYQWEDFMCGKVKWADVIHPEDFEWLCATLDEYEKQGIDSYNTVYRVIMADGTPVYISDYSTIVRDDEGNVLYSDCIITDYSIHKQNLDKIEDNYKQQQVLNEILQGLHNADLDQSFQIILDRTGEYLGISRVVVFEDSPDHTTCKAIYEWHNTDSSSMLAEKHGNFSLNYHKDIPEIEQDLQTNGCSIVNYCGIPQKSIGEFDNEGVIAAAIFAIYHGNERYGFICFDECTIPRYWQEDQINFLQNIAKLISTAVMRKKTDQAFKASQKSYETVLNNIRSYVYVIDLLHDKIIFANNAFKSLFQENAVDTSCLKHVYGSTFDYNELFSAHSYQGDNAAYYEVFNDQNKQWYSLSSTVIPWTNGNMVRLINSEVITAQKTYSDSIEHLAFTDQLTQLPNRYRYDRDMQDLLEQAKQNNESGYVIFIDMDDFKIVNDGYGHDYGDAILIEFSNYLKKQFARHKIYRSGGDEFVIIVQNGSYENILGISNRLLARARSPWKVINKDFYCTLSIGIVKYPDGDCSEKAITKNADIAMYMAKRSGKNTYSIYADGFGKDSILRIELEKRMREAIQDNFKGFEVYYQPFVDVRNGNKIVGAEALIRWFGKRGKVIMPAEFIPLAEYLGLIVPLGEFVLYQAAALCKRINDHYMPDFRMSVNVSMKQFQQQDIVARVNRILEETGVNPSNIILEITEGLLIDDMQRMTTIFNDLRSQGIQIAMDDVGTGYSSLNNLHALPIDIIKIDRSFIQGAENDTYSKTFIRLISDLGAAIHKMVCVEGVETEDQLTYCVYADVSIVQGFYFHKPMDSASLEKSILIDIG